MKTIFSLSTLAWITCRFIAFGLLFQAQTQAQSLTHRYSFAINANDSIGGANGALHGTAAISGGKLVLNGSSGNYASLPAGIINGYSAVTIEAWTDSGTLPVNCYLFSFGNTDNGGAGEDYIFCAPQAARITISGADPGYTAEQNATCPSWSGKAALHIVAVFNPPAGYLAVYTNGVLAGVNTSITTQLSSVNNVFSYIGRSLYNADPYTPMNVDEFRVWNGPLDPLQIAASEVSGANIVSTNYGSITALTWPISLQMNQGTTQSAVVMASASGLPSPVVMSQFVNYASGDSNVLTVDPTGLITAWGSGSTTVNVSYAGFTNSQTVTVSSSASLAHRYSFTGNTVDSVGAANGTLQGGATISGGKLALSGTSGNYLSLPGGLIHGYTAVTLEAWADFGTLPANCYLFSFGNTDSGGAGADYIFCAPQTARITISGADPGYNAEQNAYCPGWSGMAGLHIVAIFNPPAGSLSIYTNGVLAGVNTSITTPLSSVNNVLSYIGRSLYTSDPYAPMNVDEFRIWQGTLSPRQIVLDAASGPDQLVTDPGPLQTIHLTVTNQMPVNGSVQVYSFAPGSTIQGTANLLANGTQQAGVTGDFTNLSGVNLLGYGAVSFTSANTNILTVNSSGLITAIASGTTSITASFGGFSASQTVTAAVATNQFIFDSFGDGFWSIVNQGTGSALVTSATGASQEPLTPGANEQQFEMLYNMQTNSFRIRQKSTWLCIGSLNGGISAGTAVATILNYSGAASQQWNLVDAGGGYFQILNTAANLALQSDNGAPANVTLAASSASPFQLWRFVYQAHYPKKGIAGYEASWSPYQTSWAYNYDDHTGAILPPQVNFVPMIWGQYWEPLGDVQARAPGWHASPLPDYLLTFNEPDNSGQANMSTGTAISYWPALQALNLPLVSPAMQNTYDSWAYGFFGLIATNDYRVDYTAVHLYVNPSASGLINDLNAVYTTWGRPVWLTEFSPVDWSNTQSWSEDDDYNFLAEFIWQAEGNDWLKRYSIFPFTGSNTASPWVDNGYRGNFFLADGVTLSPYGELYATWDGDTTLHARTPYIIHNLGTSFRLTDTGGVSSPATSTIYTRNATTEWALLPAPAPNHWYIISLNDGRRLRNNAGTLDLAPSGTTNSAVDWWFNGPDGNGYYYLDNLAASQSIRATGAAPAISLSMINDPAPSSATQWRLVKPYQAVTITTPGPPILDVNYSSQTATLNWSVNGSFYNVYRGTNSGGPYTRLTNHSTSLAYEDTTLLNGTAYYYVVTALNILGDESAYSNEVIARPASTNAVPLNLNLSAGGLSLALSWPSDHTGWRLMMNDENLGDASAWTEVTGASATNQVWIPFVSMQSNVFFRLVYP